MKTTEVPHYEESVTRSVRKIIQACDQHSRVLVRDHRLTTPQLICLRLLRRNGSMSPSMLAEFASVSRATMSGIVERLVARGWVARTTQADDRRKRVLTLTPEGHDVLLAAPGSLPEEFLKRFECLPEDEQAAMAWMLRRMAALFERDPDGPDHETG